MHQSDDLRHTFVTRGRLFFEAAHRDLLEQRRDRLFAYGRRWRGFVVQCAANDLMHFFTKRRSLAAKCLVEDGTQTVNIGAMIDCRIEVNLFWRHVVSRTLRLALPGQGNVFDYLIRGGCHCLVFVDQPCGARRHCTLSIWMPDLCQAPVQ